MERPEPAQQEKDPLPTKQPPCPGLSPFSHFKQGHRWHLAQRWPRADAGLGVREENHFISLDKLASKYSPGCWRRGRSAHRKPHHLTRALSYHRPQSYGGPSKATRRPSKPQAAVGSDENWPRSLGAAALQSACCAVTSSPERGQRITAGAPVPPRSPSPQGSRPCLPLSGGLAVHTQDTAAEPPPPHKGLRQACPSHSSSREKLISTSR